MDSTTESADPTADTSKPQPSVLTLNNDILLLICAVLAADEENIVPRPPIHDPSPLKQFSTTCKRLRALSTPLIFRNLKLGGYGWNWNDCRLAMTQILACQSVQRYTKRLSVNLFTDHPSLPVLGLAELLQSMAKLENLDLSAMNVPEQHLDVIKKAMSGVTFERVNTLAIPARMNWMAQKFPSLQSLVVQGTYAISESPIEAIRQVPRLQHLECKTCWTPELLQEVYQAAPGLKTLSMQSSVSRYSKPIFDFVPTLAQFADLRSLVLASIGFLNTGFTAPRCGNAYRGPNGDKVRARVRKDRERMSTRVAEQVFEKCKALEELWIGKGGSKCRAKCVRGADGMVEEIQWSACQWLDPAGRV